MGSVGMLDGRGGALDALEWGDQAGESEKISRTGIYKTGV